MRSRKEIIEEARKGDFTPQDVLHPILETLLDIRDQNKKIIKLKKDKHGK